MNDAKPAMPDENKCPQCGTVLKAGALGGLCPACLLKLGASEDTVTGGGESASFVPPTIAELAAKFPQLEILALIGQGGMGAVYQARQRELDRIVALKILPPGISDAPGFAERFAREAKALAKLNHPGIVTIHDFGRTDGLYFFVMEFVDGVNLRQLLHASRIAPREALAIVPQICDALQFAHDHGIVHRDIKPENILLDRRGRVKVADFGLAKLVTGVSDPGSEKLRRESNASGVADPGDSELTEAGRIMGTPSYMAPEQTEHPDEVDHRADIYALGVVFYQMLTGELPAQKIEPPSRKVQIDVRLDEIVLRALEKDPARRYAQASIFKTHIETIAESEVPLTEKPETWWQSRWSTFFGSPIQQEIWTHMSTPEKWETTIRGLMFTIWNLATWFLPIFIVLWSHHSARWIHAALVFGIGVAGIPVWRKILLVGQCSTAWARHRGMTSDQLRKSANAFAAPVWVRIGGPIALLATVAWHGRHQPAGQNLSSAVASVPLQQQQPANPPAAMTNAQAATFGPVREWALERQVLKGGYDLDNGEFKAFKEAGGPPEPQMAPRWRQESGVDLMADLDSYNPGALFSGTLLAHVEEAVWSADASTVAKDGRIPPAPPAGSFDDKMTFLQAPGGWGKPDTLLFRTQQGGCGVLQILGATDHRGVKVRYKLVQAEKAPAPTQQSLDRSGTTQAAQPDLAAQDAEALAQQVQSWLALMDDGKYAESWEQAAESFRRAVTKEEWVKESEAIRQPLGKVKFRARQIHPPSTGRPSGTFAAQYDTSFENLESAQETVTLGLEKDGQWKALGYFIHPIDSTEHGQAARAAAESWLAGIDAENYAQSWQEADAFFQKALTADAWSTALNNVRKPLGALLSRKLLASRETKSLPGVPDGTYAVMQFETSFAEKKSAVETVTFTLGADGKWRASGYFIK